MASSSVAALLVGGGAPSAYAASCLTESGVSIGAVSNAVAINCINIENNSTLTGNVTNTSAGTITATGATTPTRTGITVNNSTIRGAIVNQGSITTNSGFGIFVNNNAAVSSGISNSGTISAGDLGIDVGSVSTFAGGISNSGTISAAADGIDVGSVSTFAGGISNSGTISAGLAGIDVISVSTFAGGISNSGTISAAGGYGIYVAVSTFAGGISNSGTISTGDDGIVVVSDSAFAGGISNSGTISAGGSGIAGIAVSTVSTFAGGISNSGTISAAGGDGIAVGDVSTFAGGISNSGTISGADAGIVVVSDTSFAGAISNSGTISSPRYGLIVSNISQFGSSNGGGITNSGTISATDFVGVLVVDDSIFAGGISNSGKISAGGTGVEVQAVSTFTGGISNSGTISADAKGIYVRGVVSTFAGGISNSGTIVANTGIVVTGVSTFLGAIVNSGTITGSGGTAIDISGAPNGMTVNILGGAISGNIVGNGTANGDTVNFALGSGTFTYAAPYGFSAIAYVNINSGTVVLNGTNTASYVNAGGGTLAGTGTINADFLTIGAGGTLEPGIPGSAGGTLTVNASFLDFQSGSTYDVTLSPTQHSLTALTGNATIIGGTVALTPIALGAIYSASTFPILTTTSPVTGTFNPAVTYSGTLKLSTTPTLSYVGADVDLTYGNSIAILNTPSGTNQNQQNVINGINNAILAGNTVPNGFNQLTGLSTSAYLNALTRLDGEDATEAQTSNFTLMTEFLDLMLGESGGGGPGAAGGGLGFAPDQQADALPPDVALAYDSILKAPPRQTFDQRWSTWASGFGGGSFLAGNAAVGSNNVNVTTYGSAAGMEYRPDPNTRLGFALAGSGLNWGLAQNLGTGRSDAFQAGVYAKSFFGPAYVSGALAFGNNWFTTNRTALGDQLQAQFTGQSYAARAEGGYRFAVPVQYAVIGITPYAALQTQWLHTPSYSETDLTGGGFGLTYHATSANDTRSELGTRFDDLTTWNDKPLLLRASLAWAHDWESGTALNAAFESLPGSAFTVNGAPLPPDSALTTASAQYFFTPNWSLIAKFDGEFAPGGQTYAGSGTLKYTW